MKSKDYYTTGEVAALLHVTRSTVSRKFDQGEFHGKKNPVTSDRLISHDSLMQFLAENRIPSPFQQEKKSLLVISKDHGLLNVLRDIQQKTVNVAFTYCTHTTDALVHCGRNIFDMIILDHRIDDFNVEGFRNSLERMNIFHSTNILHILTDIATEDFRGHVNEYALHYNDTEDSRLRGLLHSILYSLPEEIVSKRWLNRHFHMRGSQRFEANVPIEFVTIPNGDTSVSTHGSGTMKNISAEGALITDLRCVCAERLLDSFTLCIDTHYGEHTITHLKAEIVRLSRDRNLCAGLRFLTPSVTNHEAIINIINNNI